MDDAAKREEILQRATAETQRLADGLFAMYAAKKCPLKSFEPCIGPHCTFFLLTHGEVNGKETIAGGACSVPLIASQVGPIAAELNAVAQSVTTNQARVLTR